MQLRPYQRLAPYYHEEWTGFAKSYITILENLGLIGPTPAPSALDIACGTGVLAAELLKAGFSVVGVDISEEMIAVAKAEYPDITFLVSDMRSMSLGRTFDLVTCTFDSLNYLTSSADMQSVFSTVNKHLVNGDHFLFNINTPRLYGDKQHGTIHRTILGCEFDQILHYDRANRLSITTFQFDDGCYEEHIQKPYTYGDIVGMLDIANFKLVRAFQDSKLKEHEPDSYKIYFLAQKKS